MKWPRFLRRLFPTWDERKKYRLLAGGAASTGVSVTIDRAMAVSTFARCVAILAGDVASLTLKLYRKQADGGKVEARDHPDWPIWTRQPAPKYTRPRWITPLVSNIYTHGNGYREISWKPGSKEPGLRALHGLYPMDPDRIEFLREEDDRFVYRVDRKEGGTTDVDDSRLLHFRGFSTNGRVGESSVRMLKDTLGLAISAEDFIAAVYKNGVTPRGGLDYPGILTDEDWEALQSDWKKRHGGDNAQSLPIYDRGLKWFETKTATPEETQLLQSRKQLKADIAGFMGVPLHRLNDLEKATYNNVEQLSIDYVVYTLTPLIVPIELEINTALYPTDDVFVEFALETLLRGDSAARAQFYKELFYLGVFSIDEIRRKENLNPLPGELGQLHWMQLNLAPIEEARKPVSQRHGELVKRLMETQGEILDRTLDSVRGLTPPAAPAQIDLRPIFRDAARRIVEREIAGVSAAIAKHLDGKADLHGFVDWAETFYAEQRAYFLDALRPVADVVGLDGRLDRAADTYISEARRVISDNMLETAALRAILAQWQTARPEQIVRELT